MRTPLPLTDFSRAVMMWVRKIPRGQVATYSQIARLAGKPHAARGVGWILNSCARKYELPWHRVINSKGQISFQSRSEEFTLQKKRLEREGLKFLSSAGLDLARYQWKKDRKKTRGPRMFG